MSRENQVARRAVLVTPEPAGNIEDEPDEPDWAQWPESDPDCTHALSRGLAGYLAAVATAVGVAAEGTSHEVTDTATAYLALVERPPNRSGRDLMLVWSEHAGWVVSVETDPAEPPMVLSRLGGDPLPPPQVVARFVADALAGRCRDGVPSMRHSRPVLSDRLDRYVATFTS